MTDLSSLLSKDKSHNSYGRRKLCHCSFGAFAEMTVVLLRSIAYCVKPAIFYHSDAVRPSEKSKYTNALGLIDSCALRCYTIAMEPTHVTTL